jgi:6-phosphofructokinase 2
MRPIATLTMNPALDVATATARVEPVHKLRCEAPRYDPGGDGINVARVVRGFGGEVVAVFPAGGPTGRAVEALRGDMGGPSRVVPVAGNTRESFTVDETESDRQCRFVLPGPTLSSE